MAATQEAQIIALRNFVILALIWVLVLVSCVYVTGILTVYLLSGKDTVMQQLAAPLDYQIISFSLFVLKSWTYVVNNVGRIGFADHNHFLPKLLVSTLTPFFTYGILIFKFRRQLLEWRPFKEPESKFGSAHWATPREVKKAGLRSKKGLILGRYKGELLIVDDWQHTLLFAPTGSGKGVGFVMPNLLFWEQSVIVHDVKLENYEVTSGYRSRKLKQKVFVWNPADQDGFTHCYNPLDWVSRNIGKIVDDIQKIAKFLLPKEDFWYIEARALATGIMLYLSIAKDRPASLGELLRILRSDDVAYSLAVVLDTVGNQIHPVGYMNLASFLQKADKERSGVTSTAASSLDLWANPLVDAATAKSHFNITNFKKQLHTLYVGVAPNNVRRLRPLLQIFYQQCSSLFTRKLPDTKIEKYGVLMMMDEFPTLGEMKEIAAGVAFYRGYRVKLFLIIQDTEQLKTIYKASGMNSFLSNSTYRITFSANNVDTANLISRMLGNKTIINQNYSRPKYLDLNPGARTVGISKASRALLLPQEVINLPRDEQILLIEAHPPIRCKKIMYYKEKLFMSRVTKPITIPKQEPYIPKKKGPTKKEEKED